jgi:hypothetical protein
VAIAFWALSIAAACCTKSIGPRSMRNKGAVILENEKKVKGGGEKRVHLDED